jgi:hypothetical protein
MAGDPPFRGRKFQEANFSAQPRNGFPPSAFSTVGSDRADTNKAGTSRLHAPERRRLAPNTRSGRGDKTQAMVSTAWFPPLQKAQGWARRQKGVSMFEMSTYSSADDIRGKLSSLTIQTTPELAQQVINYIRTHPDSAL